MGTGRPPGGPRDGPGSDEKLTDDFFFSSAGVAGKGREKQIDDFFFVGWGGIQPSWAGIQRKLQRKSQRIYFSS